MLVLIYLYLGKLRTGPDPTKKNSQKEEEETENDMAIRWGSR